MNWIGMCNAIDGQDLIQGYSSDGSQENSDQICFLDFFIFANNIWNKKEYNRGKNHSQVSQGNGRNEEGSNFFYCNDIGAKEKIGGYQGSRRFN